MLFKKILKARQMSGIEAPIQFKIVHLGISQQQINKSIEGYRSIIAIGIVEDSSLISRVLFLFSTKSLLVSKLGARSCRF
jgi:hypothetical protein